MQRLVSLTMAHMILSNSVLCWMHLLYAVSIAYHYSYFGAGNGPIIYSDVDCGGWEDVISECSKNSFPQFFCLRSSVAGLLCGYGEESRKHFL